MKLICIIIFQITIVISAQNSSQIDVKWETLADSPWPMIKHDPQLTGRSPYIGPQTPNIVWETFLPASIYSGPVIGENGNLYFGSYYKGNPDYFYSYSKKGEKIWEYSTGIGEPPQAGILIDSSNAIYFGALNGYFYALNPNGSLKWKFNSEAPIYERTYPNIDLNNNLYFTNSTRALFSVSKEGELNWKYELDDEWGFYANSPAISPDSKTIYICGYDSNLYAIDTSGVLKWEFSCNKIWFAPVLDSEGNIYISPEEDTTVNMYSINPRGDIRWEYRMHRSQVNTFSIPTIDYDGNIYFIGFDNVDLVNLPPHKSLISLDFNGNFRWQYVFGEFDGFTQPLICDREGTVYLGDTYGEWFGAISSDGELKWKIDMHGYDVDNTCAIDEDGTLYLGVHGGYYPDEYKKNLIAIRDSITTSINSDNVVSEYTLLQNHPNPFNPTTTIRYSIPANLATSFSLWNVTLKVYDILGREVQTLVNKQQKPGNYEVIFDANKFTSGVYFYKITAGEWSDVKKMILMK